MGKGMVKGRRVGMGKGRRVGMVHFCDLVPANQIFLLGRDGAGAFFCCGGG